MIDIIDKLGFTPGPWRKSKSGNPHFEIAVVAPDGGSVCHITQWSEQEKNQSLIAGAPEMLEVLIEAYKVLEFSENSSYFDDMKKAIEKATGLPWKKIKEATK